MEFAPRGEWAGGLYFETTSRDISGDAATPDERALHQDRKLDLHPRQSAPDSVDEEVMDRPNQLCAFNRLNQQIVGSRPQRACGLVGSVGRDHHDDREAAELLRLTNPLSETGAVESREIKSGDEEISRVLEEPRPGLVAGGDGHDTCPGTRQEDRNQVSEEGALIGDQNRLGAESQKALGESGLAAREAV